MNTSVCLAPLRAVWLSKLLCVLLAPLPLRGAVETVMEIQVDRPGAPPTMFGVFIEDINYAADGGLYPERVKNRSFEFTDPLVGWAVVRQPESSGTIEVRNDRPLNESNPQYLRLTGESGPGLGLVNEGFFGMGVEEGERFEFSAYARSTGGREVELNVELLGEDGRILAAGRLRGFSGEWRRMSCPIRSSGRDAKARLRIALVHPGTLDLDMVSLFPRDTWKGRANGLRRDLVQRLVDLHPAFLRFPGGCIVEGRVLENRYQWKNTVGDLAERRLNVNRWNSEFKHRPAPDYFQSFGLGFYEYFLLAEDIGAKPLPILNCGMACQFNSGELVPLEELEPYVQDALDLIEFADGPVTSVWGGRRAALGHPRPFGLQYLGIGNEQWGQQYLERYEKFAERLKVKHPEIKLVSSAGPQPSDERFEFLWPRLRTLGADIIDEHCYDRPAWFLDSAFRYDAYDRSGPKVFMGEYAAQSDRTVSPENRNNWECALAEAAFMTGLERNSEVVVMAAYAPLFAHAQGWQWRPDLIWFDNLRSYATPNYYVQQLFGVHQGDVVVPVSLAGTGQPGSVHPGLFACATLDRDQREIVLKVVNSAPDPAPCQLRINGVRQVKKTGTQIILADPDLKAENSFDEPLKVAPRTAPLTDCEREFRHLFPAQSLTVLRVGVRL